MPDLSWYENYLKHKRLISERQSIEDDCTGLKKEIECLHKQCNSIKTKMLIALSRKTKNALQEANHKYKEMQTWQQLSLFSYIESKDLS